MAHNGAVDPVALAALRRSYELAGLDEHDVDPDPVAQFRRWLADAVAADLTEPNAMVLATADAAGRPSSRTVLLKVVDERGFAFFTNLESRKGTQLSVNPQASLCFSWVDLERQVVVVGDAVPLPADEAEQYFAARPRGHQLGAHASRQSRVVASREALEQRYAELEEQYPEGTAVPMPAFWGGFRLVPSEVEFWQGRGNRLHDRIRYRRDGGRWAVERLSP